MLRRLAIIRNQIGKFSKMKPEVHDQTIFDKIISKEIKSSKVYEDDKVNFGPYLDLCI